MAAWRRVVLGFRLWLRSFVLCQHFPTGSVSFLRFPVYAQNHVNSIGGCKYVGRIDSQQKYLFLSFALMVNSINPGCNLEALGRNLKETGYTTVTSFLL